MTKVTTYDSARVFDKNDSIDYINEVLTEEAAYGNIVARIVETDGKVVYYFKQDAVEEK